MGRANLGRHRPHGAPHPTKHGAHEQGPPQVNPKHTGDLQLPGKVRKKSHRVQIIFECPSPTVPVTSYVFHANQHTLNLHLRNRPLHRDKKIPGGTALERWVTKPYLPRPFFLLTQRVETGNQSHFPSYRLLFSALQRDELFLLLLNRLPIRLLWHFYLLSQLTSFSLSGPAESDRAGGNCSGVNYTRGPAWHLLLMRRPNMADTPLI